jgi:hypothetical protein
MLTKDELLILAVAATDGHGEYCVSRDYKTGDPHHLARFSEAGEGCHVSRIPGLKANDAPAAPPAS